MSHYVYQRTGGPLLVWGPGGPPGQSRAADTVSLGAWPPILPGAPEMIGDVETKDLAIAAGAVAAIWWFFLRK